MHNGPNASRRRALVSAGIIVVLGALGWYWRICSRSPHACRIAFCLAEGTACPSRRRARGSFSLLACALSPEFAARNQPLTPHMGGAAERNITARKVSTAKPPPQ